MKRSTLSFALALILIAACGDDSAETTTTTTTATTTTAAATTTTTAATTTTTTAATTTTFAGPLITLADTDLGEILVDENGMTLYLFLPDEQGPSTCTGNCANTWPPLTGDHGVGAGLDPELIATFERADGSHQVMYNGWPLYRYVGDTAPGDTNGQSLGSNWWVVDAAGEPVM